MPNMIKPFHAARLVDERCQVSLPLYLVDTSTHESLLESVEAIRTSSRTPDEVKGMLAIVNATAADLFSEEEKASLFSDLTESDGTPLTILIEAEGNYPLIFEALDQMTASVTDGNEAEALKTEVEELKTSASDKDTRITELEAEVEKLKAEAQDPELVETLKTEIETLKSEAESLKGDIAKKDESIDALRTELVEFETLKHDTLVKEAARLTVEAGRAIVKGKSFDEVCEALAARTDESLNDMVSDLKVELESKEQAPAEEPAKDETPEGETTPVVEQVEDPTLPTPETLGDKPKVEEVADDLHATITEEDDTVETYRVMGMSEAEIEAIFGPDALKKIKEQ